MKVLTSIICVVSILISANYCYGISSACPSNKQAGLFIFGDSIYDPGNNNYINTTTEFQANFAPYGETFFKQPTGRFSDGRLICDFIAEHANLSYIPAYSKPGTQDFKFGVNFASAGAGALVDTNRGLVINLKTQVINFKNVVKILKKELGDKETEDLLLRSVYLFSAGSDDYISPLVRNTGVLNSYTQTQYVNMVIGNFTAVIKDVYNMGGRKFGFLSLAPVGCLPGLKAIKPEGDLGECHHQATKLTKQHNKAFPTVLRKLQTELNGFKYAYLDLYTGMIDRMKNPPRYGMGEGKLACCGAGPLNGVYSCGGKRGVKEYELRDYPDQYVFFDSYQISERLHSLHSRCRPIWKHYFKSRHALNRSYDHLNNSTILFVLLSS